VPIGKTGMAASITWRVEGMPRYDLIGASHGFRRPGVEMFIEPGFSYARGGHVYAFQVPQASAVRSAGDRYAGSVATLTATTPYRRALHSQQAGSQRRHGAWVDGSDLGRPGVS
jgi:hypothetical protein